MTDWLTVTGMLLSGLIVGFMFLYSMKRRDARNDLERKDLEAKRDALVARLRSETNEEERTRLETDAADVLRKLDVGPPPSAVPAVEGGGPARRTGAITGFLWGAASVAVLAGIGYFVMQQTKPKETQTATAPAASAAQPQQADATVRQLEAAVQSNPTDLNARNDLAKAYLDHENMDGVIEQTTYVLGRSPDDARALTYQALVRIGLGQGETAMPMLERAVKSDPNLIDAWVGLAWVNAQSGRMDRAERAVAMAKKLRPDQAERLDALLTHLKPSTPIHVSLSVGPNTPLPEQGIIFVIARAAGVTAGPPIAVKRVPLSRFPMDVDLSTADSMTGQPLPEKVLLDVRLDVDGDPMTKSPADLKASQDGVVLGQKVALTLK